MAPDPCNQDGRSESKCHRPPRGQPALSAGVTPHPSSSFSWISASPQAIRDRLREGRADGSPAPAAAVLAVEYEFVPDLVQRIVEEDTTPTTRAQRHATCNVHVVVVHYLPERCAKSLMSPFGAPPSDKHPSNGATRLSRSVARSFPFSCGRQSAAEPERGKEQAETQGYEAAKPKRA